MLCGAATASAVAQNEVCIYEHVDFGGASQCFSFDPGMRHRLVPTLGGYINDRASSVLVGKGIYVILFEHARSA
jgi:hypothetical protein